VPFVVIALVPFLIRPVFSFLGWILDRLDESPLLNAMNHSVLPGNRLANSDAKLQQSG
jgi:hypothetical protein